MVKKRKKITLQKKFITRKKYDIISYMDHVLKRSEHWLPWIIVSVYFLVMAWFTFRYHRVGSFGVETDFYAELAHQTRKLLNGQFSPLNYGPKGPVYSLILAGVYLVIREYFYAGLIINLISSFIFLIVFYYLVKNVFNRITAFIVILAVTFNYTFQNYTYQAGSDLPFMALSILSLFFLFRSKKTVDLVFSAIFGLLAFLTRYNGAFIVFGSVLYLALIGDSFRDRLKRIGLWIAVFICIGLPWFIPNYIVWGNPVYNSNYQNVMIEFYGIGREGFSVESWYKDLPEKFSSLGDVIFYDPVYFVKHLTGNVVSHCWFDIQKLIGLRLGIFSILGFLMLFFMKPDRHKLIYFSFGIFYFLILTLVFYNERFSMYLLTAYIPLAIWPFTEKKVLTPLRKFSSIPVLVIILVTATYGYTSTKKVAQEIMNPPPILEELKKLGKALDIIEPDKSQKIIARKPHVAHYAGLSPIMFPDDAETVEELISSCREKGVRYILYSAVEYSMRPKMRILYNLNIEHMGLEKVFTSRSGIIYRVSGI